MNNTLLGIIVGAGIAAVLAWIFSRKQDNSRLVEDKINTMFPEALKKATEQLITMADQKLDAKKQTIETDLAGKKAAIEDLVKRVIESVNQNNEKLNDAEKARIGSFTELKTELENQRKISEQLNVTTENLKKVLSNNQLRGQFGEQVAEDLLRMAGFVNNVDYYHNKSLDDSRNRPDFTVLLPDGVKINVDVKFPYANLQRYIETEDKEVRKNLLRDFTIDIKEKIKQVTTRNYINSEDKTVDFVILFVPNEMIFSFIYENLNEVWADAMQRKVVFVGPFSFSATLRLIRQSYANFKIQNNVHKIVGLIKDFEKEFSKYNDEFAKIGDRIASLSKQYHEVDGTRTRGLLKIVDKVRLHEPDTIPLLEEAVNLDDLE